MLACAFIVNPIFTLLAPWGWRCRALSLMGRDDCLAFTHLPAALSFIDIASVKSCLSFRVLVFHVLFLMLELLL